MAKSNACLQINMAPVDIRYVPQTLPHQLRVLGGQVDEIQFTVDARPRQRNGTRYTTENHADKLAELRRYLKTVCMEFSNASIVEVDYSPSCVAEVARAFTGGEFIPETALNGSPFYAYLYGIFRAQNDYVFHMDSDMLYGGGSQHWVADAIELLNRHKNVLACYPLGGPPRLDGLVKQDMATWADGWMAGQSSFPSDLEHVALSYPDVSTRVFILDRRRFLTGEYRIPLVRPKWRSMIKALLKTSAKLARRDCLFLLLTLLDRRRIVFGEPQIPYVSRSWRRRIQSLLINLSPYLALEDCVSILAVTTGSRFISFLGTDMGLWSLHPHYRSERFYAELSNIIKRIESDDIPDEQRGDSDLNDSMLDWSDVRPATHWARLRERR
jgi:hypothetical protein